MALYKLLLLDIDGTLRDECYGIPTSAKTAIKTCRNKQCRVVICTGRSMGTICEDVAALSVDGYIAGGGSYIEVQKQVLCNTAFADQPLRAVIEYLRKEQVALAIESQHNVFMNEQARVIFEIMNANKQKRVPSSQKQFIQEKIIYQDNLEQFQGEPIHKLCFWSKPWIYHKVKEILQDHMEVAQEDIWNELRYYELIQKGAHKGNAIRKLQNYWNISKDETICFGDGLNDIEMFKASGTAIAMKESHEQLKMYASKICEDIMEDGIYRELQRHKLIEDDILYI